MAKRLPSESDDKVQDEGSGEVHGSSASLQMEDHDGSLELQSVLATNTSASDMMIQFFDLPDVDFGALPFLNLSGNGNMPNLGLQTTFDNPQFSQERSVAPSVAATPPALEEDYMVKITSEDHQLIQHFLNSMKQYTTKLKQGSDEDLNCVMFSNMGLFNAQVFHAMMAFSALHLAQTNESFLPKAELRYQQATALLLQDKNPNWHLDVTIVTVWFLLQYELLFARGVVRFCNMLAHLAHVLDNYQHVSENSFSILGARTLVWLSCYDCRALYSGGRGGYLLKSLEDFLPLRPHLQEPPSTFAGGPLASIPEAFPKSTWLDHTSLLRLRFRSNWVHGRTLMLLLDEGASNGARNVELSQVYQDMLALHEIFARGTDGVNGFPVNIAKGKMTRLSGPLSSLRFGHLLALSSLYVVFLDYYQVARSANRRGSSASSSPCSFRSDQPSQSRERNILSMSECSTRVLRISHFISRHRPKSPQSIWPSLLFSAGIESEDEIHRDWILNSLKGTEAWAPHFLKTQLLLQAIYQRQTITRKINLADILRIQSETTGPFVI